MVSAPLPPKPPFAPAASYWLSARAIYQSIRKYDVGNPFAIGALANADLESAFHTGAVGDKGTAFNLWQWHSDRAARILLATGIDLTKDNDIPRVVAALFWELSNVRPYAKAFADMKATTTAEEAAGIFCQFIEGAGAPDAKERREADAAWWTKAITEHADFFAAS